MMVRTLLAAIALGLAASPGAAAAPNVGVAVSDSTLSLANGQTLNFSDLRGQVVVLSYWMNDCKACEAQMTALDHYYRLRRDVGLVVLAVPVEELSDRQLKRAFKGKMVHPVSRIRGPFEMLGGLPTTYVVDRTGQIRYASSGMLDTEQLNRILVPLLRQPQP
ncbi:MAG: TlpA family protein disulfide reductase [Sphingomicrobium sp.]